LTKNSRFPAYILSFASIMLASPRANGADDPLLNLRIEGVSGELEKNIRAHLGNFPESKVQRRAYLFNVSDSVEAALESMGYYHGRLEQEIKENEQGPWELKLTITPGEVTRLQWVDIRLEGEVLNDPWINRWLSQIKIKPGDPLNHGDYEQIKSQLISLALARGYFDGHYQQSEIRVNRDLNLAQLNLYFDSGKRYQFGEVSFEGHSLQPQLLEDLVPFQPGAPYSTRKVTQLNQELLDTGYFSNIKVLPQIDKLTEDSIPVRVELSPRPDHSIELGLGADIGSSTDSNLDPRVRVTWRTPQLNSYGHSQETSIEWSRDRPKFLSTYTIPLTHPLDDQLKIRVGLLRDKYGVTQDYVPEDRDFSNTGQLESTKKLFGVGRSKRLNNGWLLNYSLEAIQESYTQSGVDYDPQFLLFGTTLSKTSRGDNSLDPKSGFRQLYSIEYADPSLGSDVRLTRMQAKFKWIETFFDKHRFVSRLDLGVNLAAEGDLAIIPPSLRYFAGGDQSIRGYSYQELGPHLDYTNDKGGLSREVVGGRYLAVGSLEYQYYLTPSWRVGTFVDAGNAFDVNQFDPVVSVGGGIHWISPIGPIKLDVGFGLHESDAEDRPWRIHLTMGTEL
jgi:translocation and assembly module TamA